MSVAFSGASHDIEYHAFRAQSAVPHGLPPGAYVDEAFYARERETLFRDNWLLAGFAHELAAPGDVRPVELAGVPLLLLRDRDGAIRVFHNACRHRGLKLVDCPGKVGGFIQCPYHAWRYGLDGALRATPFFSGGRRGELDGFDPAAHGLLAVRSTVWHDWIFVDLSGSAEAFEDFIAPLARRLADVPLDAMRPVASLDFGTVAANWKLLVENFIEPYHVQFVHPTTTKQPLLDHYTIVEDHLIGCAVDVGEHGPPGHDRLAVSSRYLALFPSFILGHYQPDQLGVQLNLPLGPSATAQRRVLYMAEGHEPDEAELTALLALWRAVHEEDHEICVRLQQGRASPATLDGGLLSPHWEVGVRRFQELVADAVGA